MSEMINLASKIEKQIPPKLVNLLHSASEVARSLGQNLYLVGGIVRDLLLEETNLDLDLAVEGNAIDLADKLIEINRGRITTHPRFITATIQWHKWSIDLATARSETYAKPGALPAVKPSSIGHDLSRRDFTISAMAICLNPGHYGELVDPYGGRDDLQKGLLRVLHDKSFIDDATRILRALRYEQRLNFQIEPTTLRLLQRDIPMLDSISGDRIRHELELTFKEKYPERVFHRADELMVIQRLLPALKGDGWLEDKLGQARELSSPNPPPIGLYLALLAYRLTREESEQLISRLRLPKALSQTLRNTDSIKARLELLAEPELTPSHIYHHLHGHLPTAISAVLLACDSAAARKHIKLYLDRLRYVKPALTGDDLQKMGIPPGPRIKEMLKLLHEARLDGKVKNRQDEEEMVKVWLAEMG